MWIYVVLAHGANLEGLDSEAQYQENQLFKSVI